MPAFSRSAWFSIETDIRGDSVASQKGLRKFGTLCRGFPEPYITAVVEWRRKLTGKLYSPVHRETAVNQADGVWTKNSRGSSAVDISAAGLN